MPTGMPASPPETNLPRRILVVEDDAVLRRLNNGVLTGSGYNVDTAPDGAGAWVALQLFDYDLLITDYDIPNVSGLDLLKKLYAAYMTLPVIMVSGTMPTAELNRQPWLQVETKLNKPYSRLELLIAVGNVLGTNEALREQTTPPLVAIASRLLTIDGANESIKNHMGITPHSYHSPV